MSDAMAGVFRRILLASHGTPGARAAESAALDLVAEGGSIRHLYIVADFWHGMTGDDWLNNAGSRIRYESHLEAELEKDARAEIDRLSAQAAARGVAYGHVVAVGKPAKTLLEVAAEGGLDLVVIGAPRPKGVKGHRSRLDVEPLVKGLGVPLLVVPHPGA
ncbi:MAG: universal stress protein [Alphaproteobacteria bacterium]|nr:universal stress protein [Alphaproteobacteria bacterium]